MLFKLAIWANLGIADKPFNLKLYHHEFQHCLRQHDEDEQQLLKRNEGNNKSNNKATTKKRGNPARS